ncbi:hypothetical protein IFM89_035448 [Coptis chinensis]|uniref:50S ribosomal protein L35 n=1 Tax=Coptis chinensis TaxID=261450 RepID=A0A835J3R1_9MAGN|nr:hypothetical protein IFM89_035448 [Coptis chinensis]
MQRWLTKLRTTISPTQTLLPFFIKSSSNPALLFHSSSLSHSHPLLSFPVFNPISLTPFSWNQCRYISKTKSKKFKKTTPAVSKLKKYKIKPYSSYKSRFKTLKDGTIRRWHEGKLHNAHLKSKAAKRRLRLPALVHPAYAKVMKKLNFYG